MQNNSTLLTWAFVQQNHGLKSAIEFYVVKILNCNTIATPSVKIQSWHMRSRAITGLGILRFKNRNVCRQITFYEWKFRSKKNTYSLSHLHELELPLFVGVFIVRLMLVGLSEKGLDFGRSFLFGVRVWTHFSQQMKVHASRGPSPLVVLNHHSSARLDVPSTLQKKIQAFSKCNLPIHS